MDEKERTFGRATPFIWVSVLVLSAGTGLFFNWATPDAPLTASGLAIVAFCWFLLVFGLRWAWMRYREKDSRR